MSQTPDKQNLPIGLELIKRFEGFGSDVYTCPAGLPTIGYGHLNYITVDV